MNLMHKIVLAFLAVSLLSGIVGFLGIYADRQILRSFEIGEQHFGAIIEASNEVSSYAKRAEGHLMLYLALHSDADRKKFFARIEGLRNQTDIINASAKDPKAREILRNITLKAGELQSVGESLLAAYDAEMHATGIFDQRKYEKQIRDVDNIAAGIRNDGLNLAKVELSIRAIQEENAKNYAESIYNMMAVLSAIAIICALAYGHFMARRISGPIIKLKGVAEGMGSGRFAADLNIRTGDEIESLAAAFNNMSKELQRSNSEILKNESALKESEKDMEQKVAEMSEAKAAMLNMMDDADELNKELLSAQEKLKQNLKELKEADVKKNEFMSIAAHEIKTPITSIHGFAQLLQNREIANDLEKRGKYLKIMDHETSRLAKLVNDILDISRADLGTVALDISEVDVGQVIDAVRTEMGVQIKAKGLKSDYNIEKGIPKIFTDKERLTQILMNLLNNAAKYTPKGKITLNVSREGNDLHFSVKDTGIGIAQKNWGKIFTRFYQVDSSYTRSAGGVGLGLSLCKEFVEILGGKIWFTSRRGKGSEFHFTLPLKKLMRTGTVGGPASGAIKNI